MTNILITLFFLNLRSFLCQNLIAGDTIQFYFPYLKQYVGIPKDSNFKFNLTLNPNITESELFEVFQGDISNKSFYFKSTSQPKFCLDGSLTFLDPIRIVYLYEQCDNRWNQQYFIMNQNICQLDQSKSDITVCMVWRPLINRIILLPNDGTTDSKMFDFWVRTINRPPQLDNFILCHYTCGQCNYDDGFCQQCQNVTQLNQIVQGNHCYCNQGYYESYINMILSCSQCHYSCQTCSSQTNSSCLTCDCSKFRNSSMIGFCHCNDGYYDNGTTQCQVCPYQCLTCDILGCLSCLASSQRSLSSGSCQCNSNYLDDKINLQCLKCYFTCKTCDITTQCTSCFGIKYNQTDFVQNSHQCVCQDGYYYEYQDQINLFNPQCKTCNSNCQTCQGNQYHCISCNLTIQTMNGTICRCNDQTYDDGNGLCQKCKPPCSNCAVNADVCTSCMNLRNLNGTTCQCYNGFIDNKTTLMFEKVSFEQNQNYGLNQARDSLDSQTKAIVQFLNSTYNSVKGSTGRNIWNSCKQLVQ